MVSQLLRNIDCAKTGKLRDNAQRCGTLAQDCEITQHYARKGAKSYVGPWNKLDDEYIRKHPPTDKIDEGGLQHDRDYSNIARLRDSGQVSKAEALKLIRDSDSRFLSHMKDNISANPWAGMLGYAGIKAKNILENLGVLDPNKFVAMKVGGKVKK